MSKQPTAAQLEARRKFAERSRQKAAERQAAKQTKATKVEKGPDLAEDGVVKTTISTSEYLDLIRQIQELKTAQFQPQSNQVGVRNGQIIGTLEKYDVRPTSYPDPRQRLRHLNRLARFAFDINYDLMWNVATVEYNSIDGVRIKEPKFTLELGRKLFNDETGEPVLDNDGQHRGYMISRLIMHEDPEAALVIAREQGIDVDETNEKDFLDEMRFLRCRDWLLECFFPAPRKQDKGKKEMVIGGRLVETYTVTSENPSKIPFEDIKGGMLRS